MFNGSDPEKVVVTDPEASTAIVASFAAACELISGSVAFRINPTNAFFDSIANTDVIPQSIICVGIRLPEAVAPNGAVREHRPDDQHIKRNNCSRLGGPQYQPERILCPHPSC